MNTVFKKYAFLVSLLLSIFSTAASAGSAEGGNGYAGLMSGVAFPNQGLHTSWIGGGQVGYRPIDLWSFGGFLWATTDYRDLKDVRTSVLITGLETNFYMPFLSGLNAGLRLGYFFHHAENVSAESNSGGLSVGPMLGYFHTFPFGLSVGGEASMMFNLSAAAHDKYGYSLGDFPAFNIVILAATVKYWF